MGKHEQARKELWQARDLLTELVKSHRQVPRYQNDLAGAYHTLGWVLARQRRSEEALKAYRQACDIRGRLVKSNPDVSAYPQGLAQTHNNLGVLLGDLGKNADALKEYAQARDLQVKLATAHPEVAGYTVDLAFTSLNRGRLLARMNQLPASLKDLDEAVRHTDELRDVDPTNQQLTPILLWSLPERAAVLTRLGRWHDADDDWDRVLKLAPVQQHSALRLQRAGSRVRAGDYRRAAADAGGLEREDVPAAALYEWARVLSRSAAAAARDGTRPLPERDKNAATWAGNALALLQRAASAGYFKDAKAVDLLKKEPELDFLRSRDDFRSWLKRLESASAR
jgi:tetratricopeptide (TPR) repeat protein